MIVILYLTLLVILLVLLKNLFFPRENFHPLDKKIQSTNSEEEEEQEEHTHTTPTILEQAKEGIPTNTAGPTQTVKTIIEEKSTNTQSPAQQAAVEPTPIEALQEEVAVLEQIKEEEEKVINEVEEEIKVVDYIEAKAIALQKAAEEASKVVSVTAQVDDKCCGVNIYERKLHNINKCIKQHIKNLGNHLHPKYNEWKEIDEEENTCQSPQHVLAKTSNCYDIVNDYRENINSLLCLSNINTENCSYNYRSEIKLEGEKLSDKEKMGILIGNMPCPNNNDPQRIEFPKGSFYYVNKCN